MITGGKAMCSRNRKIIKVAAFQKREDETTIGRVQLDWWGSVRPPKTDVGVTFAKATPV
jgi:hypothetical protein